MTNPLLQQLAPIAQPPAPGVWPLAYGWWIVIALILCLCGYILHALFAHRKQWKVKRQALQALPSCDTSAQINQLLKRVAIHYYDETHITPLSGDAWVAFLAQADQMNQQQLTQVVNEIYQAHSDDNLQLFKSLAKDWLCAQNNKQLRKVTYA